MNQKQLFYSTYSSFPLFFQFFKKFIIQVKFSVENLFIILIIIVIIIRNNKLSN